MQLRTTLLVKTLALGLFGAAFAPLAQGQPVSDDFNRATLNTALWTWIDPLGDAQESVSGFGSSDVTLAMTVPEGSGHDPWTVNNAAQLMQKIPDQDFEVLAKFETIPIQENQQEGILVKDATGTNFVRFCLQVQSGNLIAFMLKVQDGNGTALSGSTWQISIGSITVPADGTTSGTAYLKLNRQGSQWTFSISPDGTTWEVVYGGPVQQAWTAAEVGPYVGDGGTGFTAVLDYFFNTASPILNEDGQNAPPQVAITAPADQSTFAAPATVPFTVSASDPDGSVSKVEFLADGNLIGTATASPFSFTWNAQTPGLYSIVAKATDNAGAIQSSVPVTVLITGTGSLPVSDDFHQSSLNTTLWETVDPQGDGTFQITGAGSANVDLKILVPSGADHDAWINNMGLRVLQPAPSGNFQVEAKFESLPNTSGQGEGLTVEDDAGDFLRFDAINDGSGALQAFVGAIINGGGSQVSRTPIADVPLPTIANVGTVYLRVRRLDDRWTFSTSADGKTWTQQSSFVQAFGLPITKVGLLAGNNAADGNPPAFPVLVDYFFNSLAPIALEDGQTANTPPTVVMTGPAEHSLFTAPAQVTLTADAADSDGTVSKVEFYAGANLLGTASAAPYHFTWNATTSGIYSITAAATDNGGATRASTNSVTVLVGTPGLLPVSDDFNSASLKSVWSFVDPVGDCAAQTVGAGSGDAHLQITVPTGNEHDGYAVNNMARLYQQIADNDFELEAKFDTLPATALPSSTFEGISVEDANGVSLRFDAALDASWDSASPNLRYWFGQGIGSGSASQAASATMNDFLKSTNTTGTIYLRVRRQGTTWTGFTSKDGGVWTQRAQFSDPLVPALAGVHAGNCCGSDAAPFTVLVDYFSNNLNPLTLEDGQPLTRPTLAVSRSANNVVLSWQASAAGFALEGSANLGAWTAVNATVTVVNGQNTVTLPVGTGASFYRLKK